MVCDGIICGGAILGGACLGGPAAYAVLYPIWVGTVGAGGAYIAAGAGGGGIPKFGCEFPNVLTTVSSAPLRSAICPNSAWCVAVLCI